MKWLRAHSKQIMAVLVLVAMFTFVGGQALTSFLSPSADTEPVFRAFGREYIARDLYSTRRAIDVLEHLFVQWRYDMPDQKMDMHHWFLLADEARRAGVRVSDQEVQREIERLQDLYRQLNRPTHLENLRARWSITLPEVREALRMHLAIQKHARHVTAAAIPSEPQLRHYVRDTEEKVEVKFVAVEARKFVDPAEPVSPEELNTQFQNNKDYSPADSPSGFGYKLPRRVKIQYAMASVSAIQGQIEPSFEELKAYWRANKARYKKTKYVDPSPTSAPSSGPAASQPASQPAPIKIEVEMSFSEARDSVRADLQRKTARQLAEQATRKLTALLQRPWQEVRTDPKTGYKPIPEEAQAPDAMHRACQQVGREFGIHLPVAETGLLSQEELTREQGLAGVSTPQAPGSAVGQSSGTSLADHAFRIPPFQPNATQGDTGTSLQLYQVPDTPLQGMAFSFVGGKFEQTPDRFVVFRVVEAREAGAPASLDEVRADVERDVRLIRAFATAEPAARELYAASLRVGLDKALELSEEFCNRIGVTKPSTPAPFARRMRLAFREMLDAAREGKPTTKAPEVAGVGQSEAFVDACFEMTAADWTPPPAEVPAETALAKAATTQPAASPTPVVRLLPIARLGKWFVIELVKADPVDREKYETELRKTAFQNVRFERQIVLQSLWFRPADIEKRCAFHPLREGEDLIPYEGVVEPVNPFPDGF